MMCGLRGGDVTSLMHREHDTDRDFTEPSRATDINFKYWNDGAEKNTWTQETLSFWDAGAYWKWEEGCRFVVLQNRN
jgi:hypothetical protein